MKTQQRPLMFASVCVSAPCEPSSVCMSALQISTWPRTARLRQSQESVNSADRVAMATGDGVPVYAVDTYVHLTSCVRAERHYSGIECCSFRSQGGKTREFKHSPPFPSLWSAEWVCGETWPPVAR